LPRKVAHRATTARSSAHRYFLSRVSTASLGARATPGPGIVEIFFLIPICYDHEVGDRLAILARDSQEGRQNGASISPGRIPRLRTQRGEGRAQSRIRVSIPVAEVGRTGRFSHPIARHVKVRPATSPALYY
jgi:hypothetical protein